MSDDPWWPLTFKPQSELGIMHETDFFQLHGRLRARVFKTASVYTIHFYRGGHHIGGGADVEIIKGLFELRVLLIAARDKEIARIERHVAQEEANALRRR